MRLDAGVSTVIGPLLSVQHTAPGDPMEVALTPTTGEVALALSGDSTLPNSITTKLLMSTVTAPPLPPSPG